MNSLQLGVLHPRSADQLCTGSRLLRDRARERQFGELGPEQHDGAGMARVRSDVWNELVRECSDRVMSQRAFWCPFFGSSPQMSGCP